MSRMANRTLVCLFTGVVLLGWTDYGHSQNGNNNDGPRMRMECGDPTQTSGIAFKLIAPDGSEVQVERSIEEGDDALSKAIKIKFAVDAHGADGWACERDGTTLTFTKNGVPIATIELVYDYTNEPERFSAVACAGGSFDFGLGESFASGISAGGSPGFVTVETSLGTATVSTSLGQSATSIINALFNDLDGAGVSITRTSPLSFHIVDRSEAFMYCDVQDTGLFVQEARAGVLERVPGLSGWGAFLLTVLIAGVGLLIISRRRQTIEPVC